MLVVHLDIRFQMYHIRISGLNEMYFMMSDMTICVLEEIYHT